MSKTKLRNRRTDTRYTIDLEFCGHPEPRHVVRFCGEWVGQSKTKAGAETIRDAHARMMNLTPQKGLTHMPKYRWDSPQEWLMDKAQQHAQAGNATELLSFVMSMADRLDADTVQDLFQSEMDADEYFLDLEPLDIVNRLAREQIVTLLESVSIQCYDEESTDELREALRVNYKDGTVSMDAIRAAE